jgi:hypothetical protein
VNARRDPSGRLTSRGAAPRNYLAPGEHRRLFWRVMPLAAAVVLVLGWVENTWFPRAQPRPAAQANTKLEALRGPIPEGDAVLIERDEEPFEPSVPAAELSAPAPALAQVRDATFFRDEEIDAWLQSFITLESSGRDGLRRGRPRDVSFSELFGQPRTFRGRLVRMRGKLHRLERLRAPANDYGIDDYWQGWLEPAGGPPSPVVLHCLQLPDGMPHGMDISEDVEVTGYFLKNYAYVARDTIRVAPLIMVLEPTWKPLPSTVPQGGLHGAVSLGTVAVATVATALAAVAIGGFLSRRRATHRGTAAPADLDAALAGADICTVEESLRRVAAALPDGPARGESP